MLSPPPRCSPPAESVMAGDSLPPFAWERPAFGWERRFLLAEEADAHPDYQGWLKEAGASDTIFTTLFRGGWPQNTPLRTLSNKSLQLWEEAGRPEPGRGPGESDVIGHTSKGLPIMRYHDDFPGIGTTGDLESMVLYAGQSVGVMHDILPAADIVQSVADRARSVLSRLGSGD